MLFENSKQKWKSNQTTQIMKIIKMNKILDSKMCKKNLENIIVNQVFGKSICRKMKKWVNINHISSSKKQKKTLKVIIVNQTSCKT